MRQELQLHLDEIQSNFIAKNGSELAWIACADKLTSQSYPALLPGAVKGIDSGSPPL